MKRFQQWLACRRLNRLVRRQKQRNAEYARRREAAKLGWQRRKASA